MGSEVMGVLPVVILLDRMLSIYLFTFIYIYIYSRGTLYVCMIRYYIRI